MQYVMLYPRLNTISVCVFRLLLWSVGVYCFPCASENWWWTHFEYGGCFFVTHLKMYGIWRGAYGCWMKMCADVCIRKFCVVGYVTCMTIVANIRKTWKFKWKWILVCFVSLDMGLDVVFKNASHSNCKRVLWKWISNTVSSKINREYFCGIVSDGGREL